MQIAIQSVADLGLALRAVRRSSNVRLDDLAGTARVSKQFASDVEYGKPTVHMGLVFKLLAELGVSLTLDIPKVAESELVALRLKGGLRLRRMRGTGTSVPVSASERDSDKN